MGKVRISLAVPGVQQEHQNAPRLLRMRCHETAEQPGHEDSQSGRGVLSGLRSVRMFRPCLGGEVGEGFVSRPQESLNEALREEVGAAGRDPGCVEINI